ncbi:hypothetical protein ZWY2020_019501 [Hordeum vulgare]|nr:hypothetical protein ZWY2020_019501 [Hordeum vulgare]
MACRPEARKLFRLARATGSTPSSIRKDGEWFAGPALALGGSGQGGVRRLDGSPQGAPCRARPCRGPSACSRVQHPQVTAQGLAAYAAHLEEAARRSWPSPRAAVSSGTKLVLWLQASSSSSPVSG